MNKSFLKSIVLKSIVLKTITKKAAALAALVLMSQMLSQMAPVAHAQPDLNDQPKAENPLPRPLLGHADRRRGICTQRSRLARCQ